MGGLLLAKVGQGLQIAGSDAHLLAANAEKGKRGREGDAQGGGGAIVGSVGIDHSSKTHPMKANVPVQSGGIGAVLFCPGGGQERQSFLRILMAGVRVPNPCTVVTPEYEDNCTGPSWAAEKRSSDIS